MMSNKELEYIFFFQEKHSVSALSKEIPHAAC